MNVEIKIVARLLDENGKQVAKIDRKETGLAVTASTMGRDLGQEVGAALERITKKGVTGPKSPTMEVLSSWSDKKGA